MTSHLGGTTLNFELLFPFNLFNMPSSFVECRVLVCGSKCRPSNDHEVLIYISLIAPMHTL